VAAPPTKETAVQVYEMVRNSSFQELFGGFGVPLDSLALTQAQIKQFAKLYPNRLKKGGNGTFFLFKVGNEFFVAAAYFFSDGRLGVRVRGLTLERVFRAQKRHRLVGKVILSASSGEPFWRQWRGHTALESLDSDSDDVAASTMSRDDSPADVTIRLESISIVKDAIGKLPYDLRNAVLLYEYEGLPYEEISAILRCSVKVVEMKLYRERKLLRESLSRSSLR